MIRNFDWKTWHSRTWQNTLLLGFISVVYKRLEDGDNKNKDLKAKISHLTLKTMLQYNYFLSIYKQWSINNIIDIAIQEIYKKAIKIWYDDGIKQHYYHIIAALIIDYKE